MKSTKWLTDEQLAKFLKKNRYIRINAVDYKMVKIKKETKTKRIPSFTLKQKIVYSPLQNKE